MKKALGLYIHIPFCKTKCDYCSFYSLPLYDMNRTGIINKYISALLKEIDLRENELKNFEIDTVYFGGGTPSLLQPADLEKIFNHLHKKSNLGSNCTEITLECNPGNYSRELMMDLRSLGVNRIVLGVQTLNKNFHRLIGRSGPLCGRNILKNFKDIPGITHCVDIIFGIPGQTLDMLYADLDIIAEFKFEHISAYTLSIEKGTPLFSRKNKLPVIDGRYRKIFESAMDFFSDKGYNHYEVSNYAFQGYESKHNMKYWKFLPYAGFGPGAHSFYDNERYFNMSSVEEYIANNGDVRQKDSRTAASAAVEFVLSGMRLSEGISLIEMEKNTGIKIPDEMMRMIHQMTNENLLITEKINDETRIKFTREGFFKMDSLIFELTEIFL
ncbi:MAG: radical SAM family heme chaperone HemW [Spirochaetes bacterium]|nr:radical SAM family heme chaperone HemW [Spirochaetota bacterium]